MKTEKISHDTNAQLDTILAAMGTNAALPVKTLNATWTTSAAEDFEAILGVSLSDEIERALVGEIVAESVLPIFQAARNNAARRLPAKFEIGGVNLKQEIETAVSLVEEPVFILTPTSMAYVIDCGETGLNALDMESYRAGTVMGRPAFLDPYSKDDASIVICGKGWLASSKNKGVYIETEKVPLLEEEKMQINTDVLTTVDPSRVIRIDVSSDFLV